MAINPNLIAQYAKSYAGQDQTEVGKAVGGAIAAAIPTKDEKLNNLWAETFEDIFGDYADMEISDYSKDIDILSSDDAYLRWSQSLTPRLKRHAQRKGLLNPALFRSEYEKYKSSLATDLTGKLDIYSRFYKKSPGDMSALLDKNPNMRKLLKKYAPLQNPMTGQPSDLHNYLDPKKGWWRDSSFGKKAFDVGAPIAGAVYGQRVLRDIKAKGGGVTGLKARYNPFGKKRVATLTEKASKDIGKALSPGIKKGQASKVATAAQKSSTAAYNKAKSLYDKSELEKIRKKQPRGKIAKSKIDAIKPFDKTKSGAKLLKAKDATTLANKAAKKKISGAPAKAVIKYVQQQGMPALIKKVIKKVGWKGASKLLGKGAISLGLKGTGVGAAASLAIDMSTIYTLYSIITSED